MHSRCGQVLTVLPGSVTVRWLDGMTSSEPPESLHMLISDPEFDDVDMMPHDMDLEAADGAGAVWEQLIGAVGPMVVELAHNHIWRHVEGHINAGGLPLPPVYFERNPLSPCTASSASVSATAFPVSHTTVSTAASASAASIIACTTSDSRCCLLLAVCFERSSPSPCA